MKVRILYPTRAAMEARSILAFSASDRTAAVLRGPHFVCVAEYELTHLEASADNFDICENAFRATNMEPSMLPPFNLLEINRLVTGNVRPRGASHTSMSVGDAVEIGGKLYVCANAGFEEVPEAPRGVKAPVTPLSVALRAAADLQGTVGAATPAELRELADEAEKLEKGGA